jgi:rubrerythrin
MIELNLAQFAVAVAGASLAWILASTVLSRISRAKALRQSLESRVSCRLCGHVFEDHSRNPFPQCPECGAKNERR